MDCVYKTSLGALYVGDSGTILETDVGKTLKNKVNLIFTSPPFPLNRRKSYGNKIGTDYKEWLSSFAPIFRDLLTPDGSIVIELGNAWETGLPVMSTLSIEALLTLKEKGNFYLCEEFIWFNPSRLPSPAEWVNVRRIRVKDAFTRLWWLSTTPHPKANNRRVLQEYSDSMKKLLKKQKYNSGRRPSEHLIGDKSFLKDNNGAIPSNVLQIANTSSKDPYLDYCKEHNIQFHPARMPPAIAEFFIKFLTEEEDIVFDPFAGSNTTGWIAERFGREWISIELNREYAEASRARFESDEYSPQIGVDRND